MNKIDFRKQNIPFTQVANGVIYDKKLSVGARFLYGFMYSKPDGWDFSADRISNEIGGISENTVLKQLKELKRFGYLLSQKLPNGRMLYKVVFPPIEPEGKNDSLGEPNLKNSGLGEPNLKKAWMEKSQAGFFGGISNKEEYISNKEDSLIKDLPGWLDKKAWKDWLEYRKQAKKPLSAISIKKQLTLLEENVEDHVRILDNSITNGWTGLFPLKKEKPIDRGTPYIKGKYANIKSEEVTIKH